MLADSKHYVGTSVTHSNRHHPRAIWLITATDHNVPQRRQIGALGTATNQRNKPLCSAVTDCCS